VEIAEGIDSKHLGMLFDFSKRYVEASERSDNQSPLRKRCNAFMTVLELDWLANIEGQRKRTSPAVDKEHVIVRAIDVLSNPHYSMMVSRSDFKEDALDALDASMNVDADLDENFELLGGYFDRAL